MRETIRRAIPVGVLAAWLVAVCWLPAVARGQAATAAPCTTTAWVGTWAADPTGVLGTGFDDQTLRIVLTPHVGADQLRVHLSNRFGTTPVTFDRAAVALRQSGAAIVAGSSRPLTFDGGHAVVTVPAGGEVTSDPAALTFGAFQDLAVSLHVSGAAGPATGHLIARERSYITSSRSGDHTADTDGGAFGSSTTTVDYVDAVDALAPSSVGAAVLFGDSITDGYESLGQNGGEDQSGIDANRRYPDDLARRLLAEPGGPRLSVVDAGISGNRLLADGQGGNGGPSGVTRIDPDVLGVAGATDAILLEGTNDLALQATADQIETGLAQVVGRLHAAGLHVLVGTLVPAGTGLLNLGGLFAGLYLDSPANAVRVAVNAWIRAGRTGADGVVDFDAATRGAAQPNVLDPRYDSGDHLHPSGAGYSRMADTVDLSSLRGRPCAPPVSTRLLVRAGVAPARHLRVRGSLITAAADDCAGTHVTLRALHAGRTLLKRTLGVTAACHFEVTRSVAARGRIEVRVSFAGSPALSAAHAGSVYVRAR